MATLDALREKIAEYSQRYRKDDLPLIEEGQIYSLDGSITIEGNTSTLRWPDKWPLSDRHGIYAIFSGDELLYIGKASQQFIGNRLSSYFKEGNEHHVCVTPPEHRWSKPPTRVVTWAVPDAMFFEVSALEEFLIREFETELPDNTVGKHA